MRHVLQILLFKFIIHSTKCKENGAEMTAYSRKSMMKFLFQL